VQAGNEELPSNSDAPISGVFPPFTGDGKGLVMPQKSVFIVGEVIKIAPDSAYESVPKAILK
jgi:hypothetical protein